MSLLGFFSDTMIVEAVAANTLFIPKHSSHSLHVETWGSSITSDAEIAGELEYIRHKERKWSRVSMLRLSLGGSRQFK